MKNIAAILDKILAIAKDARVWLRVFILVVTGFVGAIAFSKTKVKKEDCTACNTERKELINALIDIKKDLQATVITSYHSLQPELIMFASFDTIPKKQTQQQQSQQIKRVMSKIDSILLKLRIDSLNRIQKTKT